MKIQNFLSGMSLAALLCGPVSLTAREPDTSFKLWPGQPPGVSRAQGEEKIVPERPRPFYQLTDVSVPTLTVFQPPADQRNGTAVLVCPGGGLQRLAYEHEGLEVAEWLNSLGITAFVLKYRVPAPAETGLIDAQRAMGLIRQQAGRWQVDSNAVGIIGFSAGGEIAAWLTTHFKERAYPAVDAADAFSCKPDFAGLIYPGGLLQRGNAGLKEGIAQNLSREMPPMFFAHAFNDSCENSLEMVLALKKAGVPSELHIFQEGGHGFGSRSTGVPVDDWMDRFAEWLDSQGFLDSPLVRSFVRQFDGALEKGRIPPYFTTINADGTTSDAYKAQARIVKTDAVRSKPAGFKGAGASAAAQSALNIEGPMAGVLFADGELKAGPSMTVEARRDQPLVVETEIGYFIGVDISYEVLNDQQARDAVAAVAPVIELPRNLHPGSTEPANARNMIAENIGSDRYLVGTRLKPADTDPDQWRITLRRDGEILHETTGASANGGQWHNLRSILNEITSHGYTIPAGSLIICGALGKVHPGEPGNYEADYAGVETIRFEVK